MERATFRRLRPFLAVATPFILACSVAAASGCSNAADDQAKADEAQATANKKIVEAEARANADISAAQSEADAKIARADAAFQKLRDDYRYQATNKIADLDKRISDLQSKTSTSTGRARTDREASLSAISANRDRLRTSFTALDTAPAGQWDAARADVDDQISKLKDLVDKA